MSEGKLIEDYAQVGEGDDNNSFLPGDDNSQLVDLDEIYEKGDLGDEFEMLQGFEELSLGVLSAKSAKLAGLPNIPSYTPYPSAQNARMGAEGFLTKISEGFRKAIEAIIKFISDIINWVIRKVKALFGYSDSDRQVQALADAAPEIRKEFTDIITAFGLDPAYYDIPALMNQIPNSVRKVRQVEILGSKAVTSEEAIKSIGEAIPLIDDLLTTLVQTSKGMNRASAHLRDVIRDEYSKLGIRIQSKRKNNVTGVSGAEVNRITLAITEMENSINPTRINSKVTKVFNTLYKLDLKEDFVGTGFSKIRDEINKNVSVRTINMNKLVDPDKVYRMITSLNNQYRDLNNDKVDLRKVDWRNFTKFVTSDDAKAIEEIAHYYKVNKVDPADANSASRLLAHYQKVCRSVAEFGSHCNTITQELIRLKQSMANLIRWNGAFLAYITSYLNTDIKGIMAAANSVGANNTARFDHLGIPKDIVIVRDVDAQTIFEKGAPYIKEVLDGPAFKLTSKVNNFKKQIGI